MPKPTSAPKRLLFWMGWLIGALATVAIIALLLWPVADAIARHDVQDIPASQRGRYLSAALAAARGRMLQVGTGLLAFLAFFYTARNFTLARQGHELSEQGQVTDRYTKAIDQLGSEKADVRIGGTYALERIMSDSPRDRGVITEVLAAFVRRSTRSAEPNLNDWPQADVRAAMTVIARRDPSADTGYPIDLRDADLHGMSLARISLCGALLSGVSLAAADLGGAILTGACLAGADLTRAILSGAALEGANLSNVELAHADLRNADLASANLSGARLNDADLTDANLTDAILDDADLASAKLSHAILERASLIRANLAGASLEAATLRWVNGHHANFASADLSDANLDHADFTNATMIEAIMARASFEGASLSDANLLDAALVGADLSGLDPLTLSLAGLDLTGARVAPGARLPDGWRIESPDNPVAVRIEKHSGY